MEVFKFTFLNKPFMLLKYMHLITYYISLKLSSVTKGMVWRLQPHQNCFKLFLLMIMYRYLQFYYYNNQI